MRMPFTMLHLILGEPSDYGWFFPLLGHILLALPLDFFYVLI
jgi:hypothetical protein